MDSVNDPDGTYSELASSILDDLRKCNDLDELGRVLFSLIEPRNVAIAEGDELTAAICSYFIDGTLAAFLERELPAAQLKQIVADVEVFAAEGLETWCINLRGAQDGA